jgi:hypothetical protein
VGDAEDVHGLGADLHREQDVQAPQEDGAGVQEVRRQNSGGLGGEDCRPVGDARRGLESGGGQDPADGALAGVVAETDELTLDAPAAPAWVLPGQPADRSGDRRASRGVRVAIFSWQEAVPGER